MRFESILAFALPALIAAAPTPQDPDYEFPADVPEEGIVGGTTARAGEYPFIVSLIRSTGHFCGGTLLNANTVLTAAHCSQPDALLGPISTISVRAGSLSRTSGGTVVKVRSITSHPQFDEGTLNNDVAIWKLSTPIPTSNTVSYARLPASGSDPAAGTSASVAGWGSLSSQGPSPTNLMRVTVPIIARATCNTMYKAVPDYGTTPINNNMICAGYAAGGRDSCQGDSGGPLVDSSNTLIGVVSWGRNCAAPNFPGVYARTGNYISWINSQA